jgi:hypothetical protein
VTTKYSEYDLGGWHFEATWPESDTDPLEWVLTATKDGESAIERHIPMDYRPIFGPDVGDVQSLEEALNVLIKELGLE